MLKARLSGTLLSFLLLLIFAAKVTADPSKSTNFILKSNVIGSAGGASASPAHRSNSTVGQSSPIGVSSGLNYIQRAGYQPTTLDNHPPRVNAGFAQHVSLNDVVVLDGSRSYDPDGDLLTFQWTLTRPDGSDGTSELSDTTVVDPTFTVLSSGTYKAALAVSDGTFESLQDVVLLSTQNVPPVADAGIDQSVSQSDIATLDGSASFDAENASLTYEWTLTKPDGSDGTSELSDSTVVDPTFTVLINGTYGAILTVNDGDLDSESDTAVVSTVSVAPIAKAVHSQIAYVGKKIVLDASESFDPDEAPITSYAWAFTHKPSGSLAALLNPEMIKASFVVDLPGTYIISLFVNDGTLSSFPDIVKITTITQEQAIISLIGEAIEILKNLDPSQLMSRNSADTLISKLERILKKISMGHLNRVVRPLKNDILPKIDGCALRGQADGTHKKHEKREKDDDDDEDEGDDDEDEGDDDEEEEDDDDEDEDDDDEDEDDDDDDRRQHARDWVIDCEPQEQLYLLIAEAIEILKQLK